MFTTAISTAVSESVATATAQNQNQPDRIATVSSVVASAVASAVRCSQIAHMKSLRKDIYNPSYEMWPVTVSGFAKTI